MSYILSRANRYYAALETAYGIGAPVSASNRLLGKQFRAHQVTAASTRRDKTGLRTYAASGVQGLRTTAFEFNSVFASSTSAPIPNFDPMLRSAVGGGVELFAGAVVSSMPSASEVQTVSPHGMRAGAAIAYGGELRFVLAVPDPLSLVLNAPFASSVPTNTALGSAAAYMLGNELPSVTIYDYWDPADAVSRFVPGAVVDQLQLSVSGSEAEFNFSGRAADLVDSRTFVQGEAGLNAYPLEPELGDFEY